MAEALGRVVPSVLNRLQIPVQVLLYAGLFVFAEYLVSWWNLPLPANLVGMILLLALMAASGVSGNSWYGGVYTRGMPVAIDQPIAISPTASDYERTQHENAWTEYRRQVEAWKLEAPRVARNTALLAITSLLLGLVGSVVGGWMASGEPMRVGYRRPRSRGLARV